MSALDRSTMPCHIPAPGEGKECNLKILGAANHGVRARLEPDEIFGGSGRLVRLAVAG
jgi:hypothetical protein